MTKEIAKNGSVNDANATTTLTAEQAAMVSGGTYSVGGVIGRAGCPTCTSGLPMAFQSFVNVVNPAPMQMLG